ncbi:DHA2 family efflux MFS transporter permease subunit [Kitasatospora azatica]|uniref:DHA2 family efflux MFS transporter permease subunit n=1 Tax=Kitasatospora azatica TaxID=58347 RepID=UPI00068EB150|nr:DHA2 family efflux MFS transporter permease subunit [Kitasatospora azatica]
MKTDPAGADSGSAALPVDPRRWWILGVISFAQFITAIDSSVVNVMGPTLKEAIGLSTTGLQWVMNIYVLLFGGLLLLGGRLSDILGRKQVFLVGLLVFTAASFAAGLAHSETQLLLARAAQGIAAAALSPASLSILVTSFPDPEERSKAFGVWGAVIGIGASIGTIIGGAIVNSDWRWAFWINVPVGVLVAVGTYLLVRTGVRTAQRPPTDLAGAFTVTGGTMLLVYGIVTSNTHGWISVQTLGSFAGALVLLAAFVAVERRSPAPLVPLRLFRIRSVVAGALGEFLTASVMMPIFFLLPLYLQEVLGYSPLRTGLAWLPTSLGLMICAPIASNLITRTGPRAMYLVGTLFVGGALAVAIGVPQHTSYTGFMLPLAALFGVGLVLCLIATPVVGTAHATEEDAGTTSALLNASTQIGGALGIAIGVTVLNNRVTHDVAGGTAPQAALVHGLSAAFAALLVMLVLSMVNGVIGFRGLGTPKGEMSPQPESPEPSPVAV